MTYSPWADAAERYPDVHIERCDIAPARGVLVRSERVIMLDVRLDQAGRRAALAHELSHLDLQHQPTRHAWFGRRMEAEADRLAAGRLLADVEELADALAEHPDDLSGAAASLEVPVRVLRTRLAELTDAERLAIEARLSAL